MSEQQAKKIDMELSLEDANLETVFGIYMEKMYEGQPMTQEEVDAIRSVFYAGASAVIGVYFGIVNKADELQDALEANIDLHGDDCPMVADLTEQLSQVADALDDSMAEMDKECDELFVGSTLVEHKAESAPVSSEFDLANWKPNQKQ